MTADANQCFNVHLYRDRDIKSCGAIDGMRIYCNKTSDVDDVFAG